MIQNRALKAKTTEPAISEIEMNLLACALLLSARVMPKGNVRFLESKLKVRMLRQTAQRAEKQPMSTYFTSDHHFGHAGALGLYHRPCGSVAEMDRQMIDRWNSVMGVTMRSGI